MHKTISHLAIILVLIAILSPILHSNAQLAPLATQVTATPASIDQPIDAQFTVTVTISQVVDLAGFDVKLGWNPVVLQYVSHTATPETVLNPMVFTVTNTADAAAGTYQLAAATLGGAPFTGTGIIYTVTLKVLAIGFSDIKFLLHDLADPVPNPIPHTAVNATFDNRPVVVQHQLTISVSGSGTTSPAVGSYMYDEGTVVPVTATPAGGYMFDHWVLDSVNVGATNPYSVTMNTDHTLQAVFVPIPPTQHQLTIAVLGTGTTSPAIGPHMYDEGTVVPVTATPAAGWTFDHWVLDTVNVGSTNPYSVTMNTDHELTAVFLEIPPVQYQLTISVSGSGTTSPAVGSYMYNEGTVVPVTANPAGGYMLDHWVLDTVDVGTTNPYSVTMNTDHTLEAVFVEAPPVQYDLVISVTGMGTTDPTPGTYPYAAGSVVGVTATPDSGWVLDHWELDTVNVGSTNPYSVTMNANHELTAVFVEIPPEYPSVFSSDSAGVAKNEFDTTDSVYISSSGFDADEALTIYVVPNGDPFTSAASIFSKPVQADASGALSAVLLGVFPVGEYDIWVDRNGNGVLDAPREPVDDFNMETSGFFVIPEFFAGTILGLLACFAALSMLYIRKRPKKIA